MRKSAVKTVLIMRGVLCGVAFALLCGQPAFGQSAPKEKAKPAAAPPKVNTPAPAKPEKGIPSNLDEMLELALKNNPDMRVAQAKLQEAEAELSRARLQVIQKVIVQHRVLEVQRGYVKNCESQINTLEERIKRGEKPPSPRPGVEISLEQGLKDARRDLAATKAKLAEMEAEASFLLGKQPGEMSNAPRAEYEQAYRDFQRILSDISASGITATHRRSFAPATQPPSSPMADKIRKALDRPVQIEFETGPLRDLLAYISDRYDLSFHYSTKKDLASEELKLQRSNAPLGAVLQAIEDAMSVQFVVRDYGILVVPVGEAPPGAILLQNFWKVRHNAPQPPSAAMADKLCKALDKPTNVMWEGIPLREGLKDLSNLTGIPFHVNSTNLGGRNLNLKLDQAPLGAVLQAIGDHFPEVRFVVRDYGILAAPSDGLPPGAVLVETFWKADQAKPKPPEQNK